MPEAPEAQEEPKAQRSLAALAKHPACVRADRAAGVVARLFAQGEAAAARGAHAEALALYRPAALKGHAPAQTRLAYLLLKGKPGVPADRDAARRWFREAAEQSFAPAVWGYAGLLRAEGDRARAARFLAQLDELAALGDAGARRVLARAGQRGAREGGAPSAPPSLRTTSAPPALATTQAAAAGGV